MLLASLAKNVDKIDIPDAERYYLEINGANSSATVYWNGKKLATHDGGYSTWRVDVTNAMENSNLIVFEVDTVPTSGYIPSLPTLLSTAVCIGM